jgi:uncharacterized protein
MGYLYERRCSLPDHLDNCGHSRSYYYHPVWVKSRTCPEQRYYSMLLYQHLWDVGAPVDILVETPDSYNKNKTNPHLIYREIDRTGKILYEKPGI